MEFKIFQECRKAEGWQPVRVPSASQENKVYTVLVNPWGDIRDNLCECLGFTYKGQCRHQAEAMESICIWREDDPDGGQQSPEQEASMICPACGGSTKHQIEVA